MVDQDHVIELIPAYVLNSLDRDEAALVVRHLAHCPTCRAELECYEDIVDCLGLAVPEAGPPTDLKDRLMDRIQRPAQSGRQQPATRSARRAGWWPGVAAFIRRSAPAWGAASLVLALLLVASTVALWRQVQANRKLVHVSNMSVVALHGSGDMPNARGVIVMSANGRFGTLVVDDLAPLDTGHQYQLWLIQADGTRLSGGVFDVDTHGYGSLPIWSKQPLSGFPAFGITIEPTGGSPGPTGKKVLGSSL